MPHFFQEDFHDFLKALNDQDVKYILVGGLTVVLKATYEGYSY